MRTVFVLAAALVSTTAAAATCDGIEAPLAYNACLARQGPAAGAVRVQSAAPAHKRIGGVVTIARRRGRQEMVFSPGR